MRESKFFGELAIVDLKLAFIDYKFSVIFAQFFFLLYTVIFLLRKNLLYWAINEIKRLTLRSQKAVSHPSMQKAVVAAFCVMLHPVQKLFGMFCRSDQYLGGIENPNSEQAAKIFNVVIAHSLKLTCNDFYAYFSVTLNLNK